MKKYTVRIYNFYKSVIKELHYNNFNRATLHARMHKKYFSDIIETETKRLLYIIDTNGIEIDYRHTTIEKGED